MSERHIRAMLAYASDFCAKRFAKTGEIAPMWHAVTSGGEHLYEPHPRASDKDTAMALIRAWFEIRDVVRYVYMGEAWTVERVLTDAEVAAMDRDGVASNPDAIEVVMFQAEDSDFGMLTAHRKIIRPRGVKAYLAPLQMLDELPHVPRGAAIQSEGRMVGLLPARGTKQ